MMKRLLGILLCGTAGAWAMSAAAGQPVVRHGTSVLHYLTRNEFISTDPSSNAVGTLRLQFNEQGHAQKQSLSLALAGLATNASYELTALRNGETNALEIASLLSDRHGRLRVAYRAHAAGAGLGHGSPGALPAPLDPLTDVRAVGLDNAATQTVAYAWIAEARHFQFLVKRNLTVDDTNGLAQGSISLIANPRHVNFRLLAAGLSPTNSYSLALNSNLVTTVEADATGFIRIKDWPTNAPAVLDVRQLQLLDANSNVVLSTTLPR